MEAVVLTGATGGLGEQLVRILVTLPKVNLIAVYRNESKYKKLFSDLYQDITGYLLMKNDSFDDIENLIPESAEEVILVLNAFSILPLNVVGEFEEEEIEMMIDVNIKQPVKLINRLVSYVKKNKKKLRIINLDSGAADFPLKGWGNYCAAKSYINAFLSVVNLENSDFKVVSIDPGVIDTGMQEQIRNVAVEIFDRVDLFRKYKSEGFLKSPQIVADYIVKEYIVEWTADKFREKINI